MMSEQLRNDLETVVIFRDALAHGYISHMQHLAGDRKMVPSISITISDSRLVVVSPHRAFISVQSVA